MTTSPAPAQSTSTSADAAAGAVYLGTLKLLHKHTYSRLMWYRAEIWRVALPIWTGFGAFLLAALVTATKMDPVRLLERRSSFLIGIVVISVAINVLFYLYVRKLYHSVDDLNRLMTDREIELSKCAGLFQNAQGFHEENHRYIQYRVFPKLGTLFICSNVILTAAIIAVIYFIAS